MRQGGAAMGQAGAARCAEQAAAYGGGSIARGYLTSFLGCRLVERPFPSAANTRLLPAVLGKSKSHGTMFGDEEYMKISEAEEEDEATVAFSSACLSFHSEDFVSPPLKAAAGTLPVQQQQPPRRRKVRTAVSSLLSALANAVAGRHRQVGLGAWHTGTLYGHQRGHVHLAFQVDPRVCLALLLELAAPTVALVREMASGLVRIALECERAKGSTLPTPTAGPNIGSGKKLLEETVWRAYCNGKSCEYAVRRECGAADWRVLRWRVLRALEPVSMGAGVIHAASCGSGEGDVMYMCAWFERMVGSRDSEAFYMMNPYNSSGGGGHGGPELSVYLLHGGHGSHGGHARGPHGWRPLHGGHAHGRRSQPPLHGDHAHGRDLGEVGPVHRPGGLHGLRRSQVKHGWRGTRRAEA
ncbi:uncharacterized protein LOC120653533 [Panicum virgatum]|uniref:uncharacterized protein LOC120653533 n=1 Tax=Panicum virgatum TaxID=38727 RepID=UPI0019D6943C|nr:uncharacterized protein LOC120653533 [Panicum virgatum]